MKPRRRKCYICNKLTERWQRINGGHYHCYDGCYSTTGWDYRTIDGSPAWENPEKRLEYINENRK